MRIKKDGTIWHGGRNIREDNFLRVDQSDQKLIDRFLKFVEYSSTCWLWTGAKSKSSPSGNFYYGIFRYNNSVVYAHRFSYAMHLGAGAVPKGICVMHTCDNPLCVNPFHLRLGTCLDNSRDCVRKGRQAWGEKHGHAKLTADDVRYLRSLKGDICWSDLAREYGVYPSTVRNAILGHTWKQLDKETL